MPQSQPRRIRPSRPRRALLVGLTPLMMQALQGRLAEELEVSAVPFPGPAFERAVTDIQPGLVVVDVTYLDEGRVRPLMMNRFAQFGSVLVFASESGGGWMDDLGQGRSGPLDEVNPATLLALVPQPALSVVAG
jgi:hypothetical protein